MNKQILPKFKRIDFECNVNSMSYEEDCKLSKRNKTKNQVNMAKTQKRDNKL